MTIQEFSNEFDILYNNIMSNQAPGLDDYEKSVFLTQAQEEFIIGVYSGRLLQSFEETEEIRRYLDNVVKTAVLQSKDYSNPISKDSKFFESPDDLWFIVSEYAKIGDNDVEVLPVTYDAYSRIRKNPFRKDTSRRALRLGQENDSKVIEIISEKEIKDYTIKYISKPSPIILVNLTSYPSHLSIDGEQTSMGCKLNPVTHRYILKLAVELAAKAYKK